MDNAVRSKSLVTSFAGQVATALSPETRDLLHLGRRRHWEFAVLGRAPLPEAPIRLRDWLIVPAVQDSSVIPDRALERVQAIYADGLRPQGFVVVHEAPLLLAAPKPATLHSRQMPALTPQLRSTLKMAVGVLGAAAVALAPLVGAMVVGALAVLGITLVAALAIPFVLGVALLDPILVAVTEDGYWVEIDRWWN